MKRATITIREDADGGYTGYVVFKNVVQHVTKRFASADNCKFAAIGWVDDNIFPGLPVNVCYRHYTVKMMPV